MFSFFLSNSNYGYDSLQNTSKPVQFIFLFSYELLQELYLGTAKLNVCYFIYIIFLLTDKSLLIMHLWQILEICFFDDSFYYLFCMFNPILFY